MSITISSKNQIVIPKAVRKKMGLVSGDLLVVGTVTKDGFTLKKAPLPHDLIGIISPKNDDPVERTRIIRENWR